MNSGRRSLLMADVGRSTRGEGFSGGKIELQVRVGPVRHTPLRPADP
jgi:hypothetical protein